MILKYVQNLRFIIVMIFVFDSMAEKCWNFKVFWSLDILSLTPWLKNAKIINFLKFIMPWLKILGNFRFYGVVIFYLQRIVENYWNFNDFWGHGILFLMSFLKNVRFLTGKKKLVPSILFDFMVFFSQKKKFLLSS